jgi:4-amino-4-deoxy-L-arabinose transferase-like glycosyltransferase
MNLQAQAKGRFQTAVRAVKLGRWAIVIGMGVAIVLVMVLHLAFLTAYPSVFIDEPWFSNASWTWLKTGVNFDSIHTGTLDQFGYAWIHRPFLGEWPWLISFATLGLGLFQARLVSWIFGALLLLVTIVSGRQSYNLITGVLAALLLSLSWPFLQASHYARPDIMLAVLAMLAYALASLGLERNKWWAHALAGLLIGLSPDIHPNGTLFAPALAGLYVAAYGFQVYRKPGTWLCLLGGLVGVIYYGVISCQVLILTLHCIV